MPARSEAREPTNLLPEVRLAPAPPSEARLLADALARLHADADPRGALDLLAEHRRQFPRGALTTEARVAEVEALLALDRHREALRILDRLPLETLPRGAELAVTRGELRAAAGRCPEALRDLDGCATKTRACRADVVERALYRRASCRGRAGDDDGARADLEAYLAAFPQGRFAAGARTALGGGTRAK